MKKAIMFVLLAALISGSLAASGEFLKIGVGERPCGMGEAFGPVSDNVNAIYWNPAGLSQLSRPEFSIMHMQYVMTEFRVNYLGVAVPLTLPSPARGEGIGERRNLGVIGIDFRLMTNEDTYRDENGNAGGKFANYNGVGTIAYSLPLNNNYMMGISMKYFYEQYEKETSGLVLFDVGGMYKKEVSSQFIADSSERDLLRVGIVAQNIGANTGANNFKLGASYQFSFGPLFAADVDIPVNGKIKYAFGIEYGLFNRLSLRTGYRYIQNAAPSSGFTFGFGFSVLKYGIDYSFIPYADLGITHRVSLSGRF